MSPRNADQTLATTLARVGLADDPIVSQVGPPAPMRPRTMATDYVHAVHPDTGHAVVFVPGETLPEWVAPGTPTSAPAAERVGRVALGKDGRTNAAEPTGAA
ncbi:MAG TPA: hypothetical protein PKB06_11005 [Actinotalea sp.]|nr:hypothetical protein [Actinotalea sp.]